MTDNPATSLSLTSHFYMSQRLRLHYVDWGNPDAPTIILVHGGRDHCRNWDWVARDLSRDFHVIAPDLRGHGDSQWSPDGHYSPIAHVYDLAQLIHQLERSPVTIIAHSFGAMVSLRYAGLYPETVASLVAIEGVGLPGSALTQYALRPADEILRDWIEEQRKLSSRLPRRYPSIEDAVERMHQSNTRLTPEQARHLTVHGLARNEDGTYRWKFDNYVRSIFPGGPDLSQLPYLHSRITCPVLHVYGRESFFVDPSTDGSLEQFQNARVAAFDDAGHWVHHDQTQAFLTEVRAFLGAPG